MPLLLCFVVVISGALYAFHVGLTAYNMSEKYEGQRAVTMIFLGINLCEPLINTFIIGFFISVSLAAARGMSTTHALLLTSPMAVLLIPAFGIFFHPEYRSVCMKLLMVGFIRWMITAYLLIGTLGRGYILSRGENFWLVLIAGFIVLWASAIWGKNVLWSTLQDIQDPALH